MQVTTIKLWRQDRMRMPLVPRALLTVCSLLLRLWHRYSLFCNLFWFWGSCTHDSAFFLENVCFEIHLHHVSWQVAQREKTGWKVWRFDRLRIYWRSLLESHNKSMYLLSELIRVATQLMFGLSRGWWTVVGINILTNRSSRSYSWLGKDVVSQDEVTQNTVRRIRLDTNCMFMQSASTMQSSKLTLLTTTRPPP